MADQPGGYDIDLAAVYDMDFDIETAIDTDVTYDSQVDVDGTIDTDVDIDGNTAAFSVDVQSFGADSSAELNLVVVTTDEWSSILATGYAASGGSGSDGDPEENPALGIDKRILAVDAAGDGVLNAEGDIVDYAIDVTNTGDQILTNVTVTDPLTGGLLATIPTLDVGQTQTVTASYTLTQPDLDSNATLEPGDVSAGQLDNTATADSDQTGPVSDTESVPIVQDPSIELTKVGTFQDENANGYADVGERIFYSFIVEDTGNVTLTDVTVTDPLVEITGGPIASLAPGATDEATFTGGSYTITAQDIEAGRFDNTALATGTDPNGNPVEDPDDETVLLPSPPPDDPVLAPASGADISNIVVYLDCDGDAGDAITKVKFDSFASGFPSLLVSEIEAAVSAVGFGGCELDGVTIKAGNNGGGFGPGEGEWFDLDPDDAVIDGTTAAADDEFDANLYLQASGAGDGFLV